MEKNKHLGLHIDPVTHAKLRFVAEYYGRSISGQVLFLVRECIRDYERKNGGIEVPEEPR